MRTSTRTPVFVLALVALFSISVVMTGQRTLAQDATPAATPATISAASADAVAAWGQWLFSFPAAVSPAADATGAACGLGQQGSTFFLAPSSAGAGTVTRTCTILEGTTVVVPVIAVDCSTAEAAPFNGTDAASLASCATTNA